MLQRLGLLLRYRRVCWGFWHFRHLCEEGHCLTKWPEPKQFMHKSLLFTTDIIGLWANDLDFWHAYSGCCPPSHITGKALTIVANYATNREIAVFWTQIQAGVSCWIHALMTQKHIGSQVDELQQTSEIWNDWRIMAVFVPFKQGVCVQLQLQHGSDEVPRGVHSPSPLKHKGADWLCHTNDVTPCHCHPSG